MEDLPTILPSWKLPSQGMGIQESMTPGSQRDILAAAKAAGVVIPVHIYLYKHYGGPHGYNMNLTSEARHLSTHSIPSLSGLWGVWCTTAA